MTASDFPPAPDEREPEAPQATPSESAGITGDVGGTPTVNIRGAGAGSAGNYGYTPPPAGPSYTPPTPPPYPPAQQYAPPPTSASAYTFIRVEQGQVAHGGQQYAPPPAYPQAGIAPKDPTTALLLELLGYLGFLGIGHVYAGKTGRGIALLIGWWAYLIIGIVSAFVLIGCLLLFGGLAVPILSGLWIKNELEKERAMIGGQG